MLLWFVRFIKILNPNENLTQISLFVQLFREILTH